jgi:hypothetical protein
MAKEDERAVKPPQLPYPPGTVVGTVPQQTASSPRLTEMEQRVLDQAGWKPGDPMPDFTNTVAGQRLNTEVSQLRDAAGDVEGLTPVPPTTPPVKPPEITNIGDLSPEDQVKAQRTFAEMAELRVQMATAKQVAERRSAQAAPPEIAAVPGMSQAYSAAAQAKTQAEEQRPQEPDVAPTEPSEPAEARPPTVCPGCGYDPRSDDPIEATQADKLAYLQLIQGAARFVKQYSLYDGKLEVVYRTLLPAEADLGMTQTDWDSKNGRIYTPSHYVRRLMEYKFVMQIAVLQRQGEAPIHFESPLVAKPTSQDPTGLPMLRHRINNELLKSEPTRNAVNLFWRLFVNLTAKLEKESQNPDFFLGIENAAC